MEKRQLRQSGILIRITVPALREDGERRRKLTLTREKVATEDISMKKIAHCSVLLQEEGEEEEEEATRRKYVEFLPSSKSSSSPS